MDGYDEVIDRAEKLMSLFLVDGSPVNRLSSRGKKLALELRAEPEILISLRELLESSVVF
jgi:hypothetical protein